MKARSLVVALDSVGVGHAADAAAYGGDGANTLGHILREIPDLNLPHLRRIGLESALAIIAGPFCGTNGHWTRTPNRHDF